MVVKVVCGLKHQVVVFLTSPPENNGIVELYLDATTSQLKQMRFCFQDATVCMGSDFLTYYRPSLDSATLQRPRAMLLRYGDVRSFFVAAVDDKIFEGPYTTSLR